MHLSGLYFNMTYQFLAFNLSALSNTKEKRSLYRVIIYKKAL